MLRSAHFNLLKFLVLVILGIAISFSISVLAQNKAPQPQPPAAQSSIDLKPRKTHHKEAYKLHPERGEHINIKVTPPELRGKVGYVAIEVYNYSKVYVNVMEFDIYLFGQNDVMANSHVQVDDLQPKWSDMRWAEIPKSVKMPVLKAAKVENMQMYDDKGRPINLKVYTDLIKE